MTQKEYLSAILKGDRHSSSLIAKQFLNEKADIKSLYEDVIKKALYEVGEMWENNQISVSTEHLATSVTEAVMNELYDYLNVKEVVERTIVLSTVEKEFHQVGLKMVADIFETHGWKSFFLGSNTPVYELIDFIKEQQADLLALTLSIYFNLPSLIKMLDTIKEELPNQKILVGGQAFRHGGLEILKKYSNVYYLKNLDEITDYIKKFES